MGKAKIIPPKTLLLPFQKKWVEDNSMLKIAEKSRQIGWTWSSAYRLVRQKALKGCQHDAWVSSRDMEQARLFVDDCKGFAKLLDRGAKDLGERVVDEEGTKAFVLKMATGRSINSLSSNPDAQAGKRGDRVLDEFALHKDPQRLYDIAQPGITWGGSLEIFSTHRGSQNFFNTLIREIREKGNRKKMSLHRVTLRDALDQGFLYKLQSKLPKDDPRQDMDEDEYLQLKRDECSSEEAFQQEYMCVPADDDGAFFGIRPDCLSGIPEQRDMGGGPFELPRALHRRGYWPYA